MDLMSDIAELQQTKAVIAEENQAMEATLTDVRCERDNLVVENAELVQEIRTLVRRFPRADLEADRADVRILKNTVAQRGLELDMLRRSWANNGESVESRLVRLEIAAGLLCVIMVALSARVAFR